MIQTKETLSLIRGGFTEQFVKILSPIELGAEIRGQRERLRQQLRIAPSVRPGIDLVA